MSAATLLQRLDMVRQTGPDRWIARCPAHADKSPSLSIREKEDGQVLLRCVSQDCGALAVLRALGCTWGDLFPQRPAWSSGHHTRKGPPVPYVDALRCIAAEGWVILVAGARLERGERLTDQDMARLTLAVDRVATATRITGALR